MSIFDLPQQPEIRHDNINARYMRVEPLSGFSADRFSSTQLNFQFNTSSSVFWDPSKSYFRIRSQLVAAQPAVRALVLSDNIAPSQYFAANLWSSIEYQLGGQTVSRCPQDVALAESFFARTSKSGSWMDKVGQSTLLTGTFRERQNIVCSDGVTTENTNVHRRKLTTQATATFTVTDYKLVLSAIDLFPIVVGDFLFVKPTTVAGSPAPADQLPLEMQVIASTHVNGLEFRLASTCGNAWVVSDVRTGITVQSRVKTQNAASFETCYQANSLSIMNLSHGIPGGSHRFSLTPNAQYLIDCVESPGTEKTAGVDYNLKIQEVVFFAYMVQSPIHFDDVKYSLNTSDVLIQRLDIPTNTGTSMTKIFSIAANTRTVAIGFQGRDQTTGNQKSKLVVNDLTDPGAPLYNCERELNRFFIQYRGKQWPSPDSDIVMTQTLNENSKNFVTKMYFDTMVNNGLFPSAGGCENLDTFMSNGIYFLFEVAGDTSDNSTSLVVNFSGIRRACDVIVFAISDSSRIVTGKDGRIVGLETSSTLGQTGTTQGGSGYRYHY